METWQFWVLIGALLVCTWAVCNAIATCTGRLIDHMIIGREKLEPLANGLYEINIGVQAVRSTVNWYAEKRFSS